MMSDYSKEHSNPTVKAASETDPRMGQFDGGDLVSYSTFRNAELRNPSVPPPLRTDSSIDPMAIFNALRRRWFLALSLGILFGTSAAVAAWYFVPAPYTAYSELWIKSVPERVMFDTAQPITDFKTYKNTRMRLAKGPIVLAAALRDPKLSSLEIVKQHSRPVDWLQEELVINSPAEEFIRLSLSANSPDGLAEVVNAVTQAYFDEVVNSENNDKKKRLVDLKNILAEQNEKLKSRRVYLKQQLEFQHTTDPKTLNMKQQMEVEYNGALRKLLVQVRFDLRMAKNQLSNSTREPSEREKKIQEQLIDTKIEHHEDFVSVSKEIDRLELLLVQYEDRVAPTNLRLAELKKSVETKKEDLEKLKDELRPTIELEVKEQSESKSEDSELALQEKVRFLEIEQKQLEEELIGQEKREQATGLLSLELEELRKEISLDELIIQQLSNEANRLEIEMKADDRISLHTKANTPTERDNKKKYMSTAFGGFGFFTLFFTGIVWMEYRSRRIGGMEEVTQELNIRVMGTLPNVPRSAISGGSRRSPSRDAYWKDIVTESIDSARTMLLREADSNGVKLVMVTSALASEGKTTLSCHLATSLVRAGKKVLLIDGDLRSPGIHTVYEKPLFPGLGEILSGNLDFDEVIQETSHDGLWIMPAGVYDENVHQCLALGDIEPIFHLAKQEFDFVLVDSSPVLPVTDSLMIAQHCDAILFSIRRDVSQVMKVAAAKERFDRLQVPVLGAVVIGLENSFSGVTNQYYARNITV